MNEILILRELDATDFEDNSTYEIRCWAIFNWTGT